LSKNDVTIRIANRQYRESLEPKGEAFTRELTLEDEFEIMTEGTVYTKQNATYISYDESEKSGLENRHTVIKVTDDAMNIRRFGKGSSRDMDLHLEPGMIAITRYRMPMGSMDLEVYTSKLERDLDESGYGKIFAEYSIRMQDVVRLRNQLEIRIQPD